MKTFIYLVGSVTMCQEFCKNVGALNVPEDSFRTMKDNPEEIVKLQMSLLTSPVIAFSYDKYNRFAKRQIEKEARKKRFDFKFVTLTEEVENKSVKKVARTKKTS